MKTIVCYGDSNTWGFMPCKEKPDLNSARFDEKKRWTMLLQQQLGVTFKIEEEGLNGRTTAFDDPFDDHLNGLRYIENCMLTKMPIDLVILMLGTNDMKEYLGIDAYNSARGIEQIILRVKQNKYGRDGRCPKILVVSPVPIEKNIYDAWPSGEFGKSCCEKQNKLASNYEKIAKEQKCYFLNASDYVCASCKDAVHLDEVNHEKLAQILYKEVVGIFE